MKVVLIKISYGPMLIVPISSFPAIGEIIENSQLVNSSYEEGQSFFVKSDTKIEIELANSEDVYDTKEDAINDLLHKGKFSEEYTDKLNAKRLADNAFDDTQTEV